MSDFIPSGYILQLSGYYQNGIWHYEPEFSPGGIHYPPPWYFYNPVENNPRPTYSEAIRSPAVNNNAYWCYELGCFTMTRLSACALLGLIYGMTCFEPGQGFIYDLPNTPQERYGLLWWTWSELQTLGLASMAGSNGWHQLDAIYNAFYQTQNPGWTTLWHTSTEYPKNFVQWSTHSDVPAAQAYNTIFELMSEFWNQYGTLNTLSESMYLQAISADSIGYAVRAYQNPGTFRQFKPAPTWLLFSFNKKKGGGKLIL